MYTCSEVTRLNKNSERQERRWSVLLMVSCPLKSSYRAMQSTAQKIDIESLYKVLRSANRKRKRTPRGEKTLLSIKKRYDVLPLESFNRFLHSLLIHWFCKKESARLLCVYTYIQAKKPRREKLEEWDEDARHYQKNEGER